MTPATWRRQLRTLARASGWKVGRTKSGHYRLTRPDVAVPVFAAGSPSNWRALKNVRAEFRRGGARVAPAGAARAEGSV